VDSRPAKLAALVLRLVARRDRCRGILRSCAGAVTHRASERTGRPRPPSKASSGHDDTVRRGSQARRSRPRSSPAQRVAARCRGGAGRWAIRWAKPSRIGRYHAQHRALAGLTIWPDLQVFRRSNGPRTPCFTRERSQVRNPPRPSEKWPLAGTLWQPPVLRAARSTPLRADSRGSATQSPR
jgi:hypothetical protein